MKNAHAHAALDTGPSSSGRFAVLEIACSHCGDALAHHPWCVGCGEPRACEPGAAAPESESRICTNCVAEVP